jgi:5,5'-dehydrodivanillate O-demethylase
MLGEDLVLFRDKSGGVGLIQDHCVHRGASLLYGRVEERGIACAYHGWLYDTRGNCLETPAEPADSKFFLTVKATAYPVRKFVGLYWAYLGPLPAPEIPRYDVWARKDGVRDITVHPQLDCNWVQPMENSSDPAHLQILHQHPEPPLPLDSLKVGGTTRGGIDGVEEFAFYEWHHGLMKTRRYTESGGGGGEEHPILFPNILRVGTTTQIRVPIDDTHTYVVFVRFQPTPDGSLVEDEPDELPLTYVQPYKTPGTELHPVARFQWNGANQGGNQLQDYMAWETQGPIANRPGEHLATSDRGVVQFRTMLRREIEKVQRGEEPMGVVRDPSHAMIDTKLDGTMARGRYARARAGTTAAVGE